uniref:Fibronectin type-III domain-containing protein n=2 Tax=Timema TaxID=61471 RepID=A0A7R9AUS0_TIMSH|nr:unnamed protein product [Timema douglasi]CAD7260641.1 unnamed protein product [Timema shepardi]
MRTKKGCCFATDHPLLQEVAVDWGDNITLSCTDVEQVLPTADLNSVVWNHEGRRHENIQPDAPPPALVNVTIHPSTVLALLLWDVASDGGYPIIDFTAQFRERYPDPEDPEGGHWHSVMPEHISPNVRQIDIYHLDPNTTYVFKIWATNQLGHGEATLLKAKTLHDIEEIELARHLLDGAEKFDTRVWVAAVAVVMGTLLLLAIGTCYLLYKECDIPSSKYLFHHLINRPL